MKKLFAVICMLTICYIAHSQEQNNYTYSIKIENVTDYSSAKMVTDFLREEFISSPEFDDAKDIFTITSEKNFSEEELRQKLFDNDKKLLYFERRKMK